MEIEKAILSLEVAALERWNNGDPSGFLEMAASDVTYFDPFFDHRLDGKGALAEYYESIRGQIHVDRYEIIRPSVQHYSDTAVLTYNLVSFSGESVYRWNCTEVYRLEEGRWLLSHTHWAFTKP